VALLKVYLKERERLGKRVRETRGEIREATIHRNKREKLSLTLKKRGIYV
jgi:hypothetical protein